MIEKKEALPRKFTGLTFVQGMNKALFVLLMVVITCLPAGLTNATFYSEATIKQSTFSTGCWVQPTIPVLVSLLDNAVIHQGNPWLSNPLMTWNASETSCPTGQLQYQFRVATDSGFTNVVQTSDWLNTTEFVTNATASGEYYWDVTVRDSANLNINPVTTASRHYTVDLTDLQAPEVIGWNLQSQLSLPGDVPTDLTCGSTTKEGDDTHQLSTVWSMVTGSNVRYQRELVKPNNAALPLVFESTTNSPYFSLGNFPDIVGTWKTRVRAFEDANSNNAIDSGERVSAYSSYCQLTVEQEGAQSPVVLNEILPDPQGQDNFVIPFGEWVEIYNRTDQAIDIDGWKVTADPNDQYPLVVTSTNTFPGLAFGVGTTILPANGFLVVYRDGNPNFDLMNIPDGVTDSETVRLFNSSNVLQDEMSYTSTRENKSITRIPDGADNWVDPIPSPGRPNVMDASSLEPWAMVAQQDAHRAIVAIADANNYQTTDIVLEYQRVQDGEEIMEAMTKQVSVTEGVQFISDLFLGSVSSGTEYPHTNISNVQVHITLHSDHLPDKTIDAQLSGNWSTR